MKYGPFRKLRFMREHRWTNDHLSDYIDRELEDLERRRFEAHVSVCPECHRVLATLRRTLESLRSLGGAAEPNVADEVLRRFREEA